MIRILFVCHGNICRSPMAEFVLKNMVKSKNQENEFYISSAATSTEEIYNGVGNPVYPPAKAELAKHNISCNGKRAVQLKKSDYEKYDYLLGMDSANIRNMERMTGHARGEKIFRLLDFSENPRDIADPWYTGDFTLTYSDIVEGCTSFLNKIQK